MSTLSNSEAKSFDAKRCHCGEYIAALNNPNDKDAANWRFCKVCVQRKFCRQNDKCPSLKDSANRQSILTRTRADVILTALNIVLLVTMIAFTMLEVPLVVIIAGTLFGLSDSLLLLGTPLLREMRKWKMGSLTRSLLRTALIVVAYASSFSNQLPLSLTIILTSIVTIYIARLLHANLDSITRSRTQKRVSWHNFQGESAIKLVPKIKNSSLSLTTISENYIWIAILLTVFTQNMIFLLFGGLIVLAINFSVITFILLQRMAYLRREPGHDSTAIHEALNQLAPVYIFHQIKDDSSPELIDYTTELASMTSANRLVVTRQYSQYEAYLYRKTPVIFLPSQSDTQFLELESNEIACYFTHHPKNSHLLRIPNLMHCFIDLNLHEVQAATRVYDEIWVGSEARKAEYLALGEGYDARKIKVVPIFLKLYGLVVENNHSYLSSTTRQVDNQLEAVRARFDAIKRERHARAESVVSHVS